MPEENKAIWKFQLVITDRQTIRMPIGARILSAQMQKGNLYLWALIDPDEAQQEEAFRIFGTGHPVNSDDDLEFISSVHMLDGALVWHVFKEVRYH